MDSKGSKTISELFVFGAVMLLVPGVLLFFGGLNTGAPAGQMRHVR